MASLQINDEVHKLVLKAQGRISDYNGRKISISRIVELAIKKGLVFAENELKKDGHNYQTYDDVPTSDRKTKISNED